MTKKAVKYNQNVKISPFFLFYQISQPLKQYFCRIIVIVSLNLTVMKKKHEILNPKIVSFFILLILWYSKISAEAISVSLDWVKVPCVASADKITGGFTNVNWKLKNNMLVPYYFQKIPGAFIIADFRIGEEIGCDQLSIKGVYSESYFYQSSIVLEQGQSHTVIYVYPVRYSETGIMKLLSKFSLEMKEAPPKTGAKLNKKGNTENGILADGKWYKMSISKSGLYKIDAELLSKMGINPVGTALKSIKVFGNGGLMLPEPISVPRADDLVENPVYIRDQNGNNKMDGGDYLLFYGQGPNGWWLDTTSNIFKYSSHYYDSKAYYFLTLDGAESKRIGERNDGQGNIPAMTIKDYDYLFHREFNEKNVIRSGREWFSPIYKDDKITIANFSEEIPLTTQPVTFRTRLSVRAVLAQSGSSLSIKINNNTVLTRIFSPVYGEYDREFMTPPEIIEENTSTSGGALNISFDFSKPKTSDNVYLDYYEILSTSDLKYSGVPLSFRKKGTQLKDWIKYEIAGTPQMIWDVSDFLNPVIQNSFSSAGITTFLVNGEGKLKEFIAFDLSNLEDKPIFIGKVENQNLHAMKDLEYVIIAHPNFKDEAKRLGEFHLKREGYTYALVTPQQIYNEFSSGTQDVTAIRDFLKMLYDRGQGTSKKLKNVLMFGDASYDYKNPLTNLVASYESPNSYSPTDSYVSDDYYAILDDGEGYWGIQNILEGLDIGIGRIPASTKEDAKIAVDKVINYHKAESFGDWRNQITFVGDDEDGNIHLNDVERITAVITNQSPSYNVNKIYLDAYKQVSFGSGDKYPDVNEAIEAAFDRGHLIFNWIGHGGGSGLAHERVVTRAMISAWTNKNKLPLFITATCTFTQFDDPIERSPGELFLFNPNGGGIGLISTSRVVWIGLNSDLNEVVFNRNIFEKRNGVWPTMGQVYADSKNNSVRDVNQRNFILIGDPALTLAYPKKEVVTTKINEMGLDTISDTLRALSIVTIEGEVRNGVSLDNEFSGTLYPTVYDKFLTYKTLGNDPGSYVVDYKMQNSVLYKGIVSIEEGKFKFSFVVPKDISYQYGFGKISYYATNGQIDASGYNNDFYVGGSTDQIVTDNKGPKLKLFMEDSSFKFGDMVSSSPLFLANIFDENGINTVGNGIGRDIVAILDKGTSNEKIIILNSYYSNKLDSYQYGEIRYPMGELQPGKHSIHLKIWDSYNNSADAYTEFIVGPKDKMKINAFFSYPNPATDYTTVVFNHNKGGMTITTDIIISSIDGKLIYQKKSMIENAPTRIETDSRDEQFLKGLAAGMYIIKLSVTADDGSGDFAFDKLIIR
jgi:hypothetical protein